MQYREDEAMDDPAAARRDELRDIHHRIDDLERVNAENHRDLQKQLHKLEVAVATGSRFPASAWVAATAIVLSVIGTGGVLFSKLDRASMDAGKALTLIEGHMNGASARYEAIQKAEVATVDLEKRMPIVEERLKSLEGKIVGQGPEGWHRRDHDLYARMMDERNDRIRARLEILEKRQEQLCERVKECQGQRR